MVVAVCCVQLMLKAPGLPVVAVNDVGAATAVAVAEMPDAANGPGVPRSTRTCMSYSAPAISPVKFQAVSLCWKVSESPPLPVLSGTSVQVTPVHDADLSFRRTWSFVVDVVYAVCCVQVTFIVPGAVPPAAVKPTGTPCAVALAVARLVK